MADTKVLMFYVLTPAQRKALKVEYSLCLLPQCAGWWKDVFLQTGVCTKGEVIGMIETFFQFSFGQMTHTMNLEGLDTEVTVHLFKFTDGGLARLKNYIGLPSP